MYPSTCRASETSGRGRHGYWRFEYYFLQLCSYSIEDLRERVKTHIGGDDKRQRIADEILRFIYDEKFDAGDGINYAPDHDIPAYKEVFKIIFEALSQKSHYLKMSGVGE